MRSGNSHVTSQPGLFPKHPPFEGIIEAFIRIAATHRWAAKYLGYIRYIRKRFCKSTSFLFSSCNPQELNSPWKKTIEEPIHMSTAEKSERPERDQDLEMPVWTVSQRFSHLQWRRLFKELWVHDQQRLQISDLHFDKFPTPATFACWKIRFKTEVCTCSQFPTEAIAMDQGSGVG